MEQETVQSSMAQPVIETTVTKDPALSDIQMHLNKITDSIKENTVALVEMGIIIKKLEETLELLIKERSHV